MLQGAKYHPDIYGKLLTEKPDHFPDKKPPSKGFFSSDAVDTANDITNNHFNNEDAGDDDDLYRKKKSFSWVKYGEDTNKETEESHHQNKYHLDSPEHYIRNEIPITSYKLLTEPEETDQKEKNNMKEQEHVDGEQMKYDDNIEAVYDKALPYLDKWFLHAPNYRMFNQFLHRNGIKNNIFKTHKKSENSNREPKYFEFNDQPRFNHLETIKESNLRQRRPARKFTPNTSKELKSRKNNASHNSLQRQEFQLQPVFTPSQQIRVTGLDFLFSLL